MTESALYRFDSQGDRACLIFWLKIKEKLVILYNKTRNNIYCVPQCFPLNMFKSKRKKLICLLLTAAKRLIASYWKKCTMSTINE